MNYRLFVAGVCYVFGAACGFAGESQIAATWFAACAVITAGAER